jgi:hypothetical protein
MSPSSASSCQAGPVLTEVTLQACLNGGRPPGQAPVTPAELAAAAAEAIAAGAHGVHVHPRDHAGAESLLPGDVGAAVAAVRAAVGPDVEIGVTTGAWISPGVAGRRAAVEAWEVLPDSASVNWHEDGAVELAELLQARGVGIEAGLWSVDDAVAFLGWPERESVRRILVEATTTRVPPGWRRRRPWSRCCTAAASGGRCSCTVWVGAPGRCCGGRPSGGTPSGSGWRTCWCCRTGRRRRTTRLWCGRRRRWWRRHASAGAWFAGARFAGAWFAGA